MIKTKWDHIHLRSSDPDGAAIFFENVLGAVRRNRTENADQLRVTVDLAGILVFIDRAETGAIPVAEVPVQGVDHLAFTVESVDDALSELRTKGVEILSGPTNIRPGLRVAFVRGPDRIRIELLERSEAISPQS